MEKDGMGWDGMEWMMLLRGGARVGWYKGGVSGVSALRVLCTPYISKIC